MMPALFRRKDGDSLHKQLSMSRRFLPFMLGGANDAWLLWEEIIRIQPALDFAEAWNVKHADDPSMRISLHHMLLRACSVAYAYNPRMNRFVAGDRYYQRKGCYISFSAKKEFSSGAGLLVFKRDFPQGEPLEDIVRSLNGLIQKDRKVKESGQEKEQRLYLQLLPRFVIKAAMWGINWLDAHNLLPQSFIEHHPLYAGMFVSNLGSLGINSGWHHLYNQGNISLFGVMGAPYDAVLAEDGQPIVRKVVSLKWTFDERIEDGFNAGRAATFVTRMLENPELLIHPERVTEHPAFEFFFTGKKRVEAPPTPDAFKKENTAASSAPDTAPSEAAASNTESPRPS